MNKRKRGSKIHSSAKLAALLTLAIVAAGCQSNYNGETPDLTGDTNAVNGNSYMQGDTPQKNYLKNNLISGEPTGETADPGPGGGTSAESNVKSDNSGSKSSASSEPQWNSAKPLIMGLAIGDARSKLMKRFGEASDTYTLEDGDEAIEVHEYKGFSVGINGKNTIQYVEVYDASISTGISGIRVGDKTETAVKALGKPNTQNSFILTYEGKSTLLKLDLDPDHSKIVSIKLLAVV